MKNELLITYQNYLLNTKKTGRTTAKNYLADVRKFITWFESTYKQTFLPNLVTRQIADTYLHNKQTSLSTAYLPSARSIKRYASSLRKFYLFLKEQDAIQENPFELNQRQDPSLTDPWHLKEFKNYLFLSNVSKVTLKNYVIDIRQFTEWTKEAVFVNESPVEAPILTKVDSCIIDEYKKRLLHEANLSPVSINRKLSSLRKYFSWAKEKGLMQKPVEIESELAAVTNSYENASQAQQMIPRLTLEDLQQSQAQKDDIIPQKKEYSQFAPLRFLQKTGSGINFGIGLLILTPIDKTAEFLGYSYWKLSGRKVFGSVEEIVNGTVKGTVSAANIQLQAANPINQSLASAKILHFMSNKLGMKQATHIRIKGFPKSFYAPLKISTANLPFTKKMWHHVRHTRPAWYQKYHSYQIVNYLHYGILLFATTMIGFHVYTTLALESRAQVPLIANPSTAPPRTLSFQGKLRDANNVPITADTNLRFAIYKSQTGTGSAQLWEETQRVRPSQDGSFSVTLGKKTTLQQNIFTDYPSLFLGISVGSDAEMQPRQPLANVTNATNASTLDGLKPITDATAGIRNVVLALDSSGNLTIGGNASPIFQATGGEFTLSGQILTLTTNEGSNSNIQIKPDGAGIIDLQKPIQNTSEYNNIPSALGAVEIDDMLAILATSSGQSALTINQNGTGPIISASAGGTAKFTVDSEGNTAIGGTFSLQGNNLSSSTYDFTLLNSPINISFGANASSLTIGATHGVSTINNSLKVNGISTFSNAVNALGLITANEGLAVSSGKSITLDGFKAGSIPFINSDKKLASDTANLFWDQSNKRLGIGTDTPGSKFSINGLETGTGTAVVIDSNGNFFRNSSSRRYKDDINPVQNNPLVLLNASPVTFRYKGTNMYDIGFIAEDFEALGLKDLVIYDKEGKPDAIKYDKISVYVLEIVKQQQQAIQVLEETVATIKAGYIEMQQITSKATSNISENIMIGGQTVKTYIDEVVSGSQRNTANNFPTNQPDITSPVASTSAQAIIPTPSISYNSSSMSADLTTMLATTAAEMASNSANLYTNSASISASASTSGTLYSQSSIASTAANIEPKSPLFQPGNLLQIKYQGEKTDYANIASYAADLAFVPNFKSDYATFNQGLIALGPTSLTDVGVSGRLSVGGNLNIDNNSINTIASDLNLQSLRQGNLSIMGGLVMIDTQGNLNVEGNANFAKDVTVRGKFAAGIIAPVPQEDLLISLPEKDEKHGSSLIVKNATGSSVLSINQTGDVISSGEGKFNALASKSFKIIRGAQADTSLTETTADGSAGTGVITAYERERTIRTPYVTKTSLIYVTATSNTQQVTPYVARQSDKAFTVQIPETVTKDITFNWWIVN